MDYLWTGLLLGFMGSAHCAGMCGPIAVALPGNSNSYASYLLSKIVYNTGRVFTYMVLGLVAGSMGLSMVFAGYQQMFSILAGITIIIIALLPSGRFQRFMHAAPALYKGWFGRTFRKLITSGSKPALLGIGLMNGLLPCGFVYLGLAGSAATGSPVSASLYMGMFGLGTFPVMITMAISPKLIKPQWRQKMQKALPYAVMVLGILLIIRGFFISPDLCGDMHSH